MKFKITYHVYGMQFTAEADTIARAYEYIKAIIQREAINFPDQDGALSSYMEILADMQAGEKTKHEMFVFDVEAVQDEADGTTIIDTGKVVTLGELIVGGDIGDGELLEIFNENGDIIRRGCWYEDRILEFTNREGVAQRAGSGNVQFCFCKSERG